MKWLPILVAAWHATSLGVAQERSAQHPGSARVILAECLVDGTRVPCGSFKITLKHGTSAFRPEYFTTESGASGFIVPEALRGVDFFGVTVETPKGTFGFPHEQGNSLQQTWRLIIDHKPFQEEWRYLTHRRNRCIGIIEYQWGEPERLAARPCTK